MATKSKSAPDGIVMKLPESLSIKDIISVVSLAVTLTIAWGVFSTRISLLERDMVTAQSTIASQSATISELQKQNQALWDHQQTDEILIDQLFTISKKPLPNRRISK